MVKNFIFLLCSIISVLSADYLPYLTEKPARLNFAQLYLASEVTYLPASGSIERASQKSLSFSDVTIPSMTIGGTHFWGKADFFVTFPLMKVWQSLEQQKIKFSPGIQTGFKWYVNQLQYNKLSLFTGFSWSITTFQQKTISLQGAEQTMHRFPLLLGVTLPTKWGMFEVGTALMAKRNTDYYQNQSDKLKVNLPSQWIYFSYKFVKESSISSTLEREQKKFKSDWTLSLGPSSAIQLSSSSYNQANRPYLQEGHDLSVFPEFGLGYYFSESDSQVDVVYRDIGFKKSAYGVNQQRKRQSLSLEFYKFFFDYHGFVPFLGASFSYEHLKVKDDLMIKDIHDYRLTPGLVFGWDIRPNRFPNFILRTNLRYFPQNKVAIKDGKRISFEHLEFNFIKIVFHPGRMFYEFSP